MKVAIKNLTKVFPNKKGEDVVAVNNFDYEIPDGKLIGLLGPSGCGKSTTLYMLSGLLKPSSGQIFFGDEDVTGLAPEKRGVGLVFQNYALYPHMTVRQNIMFPLQNQHTPKVEMNQRVLAAAKLVQLENHLDRKPSELSGGQQQRVAIARALVKSPRVLLLDEPLSNLDARLRLQTREEIKRIQQETKVTTVFVTHDQEEAMSISDYIVVMKLGLIQQIDVPQRVYDNPVNLFVAKFLGTPPINVFTGYIKNKGVYIGEEKIMDCDYEDQDLYIGIRPEGFIVDPKGPLSTHLERIEVMGRDKSIVSTTPFVLGNQDAKKDETPIVRSIIDTDTVVSPDKNGNVHFSIKPNKIFLFNRYTELRVNVEEGGIVPKAVTKEQYEAKLAEEAAAKAAALEEKENNKVGSKFKNIFKKKNKKTEEE
jgi:multiple sugar transport system ATP-binding protein